MENLEKKIKMKKQTEKEKPISKEDFEDKKFVNYNLILNLKNISTHLEEIKRINFAILEILNVLYQKVLEEEPPEKKKIQREGTFKNK